MMTREQLLGDHLGERLEFTANLSRITANKILLTKVKLGDEMFDHTWVDRKRFEEEYGMSVHHRIRFTGVPYEYIGLDENDKMCTKMGIKSISKVKYLYKLRKGQR